MAREQLERVICDRCGNAEVIGPATHDAGGQREKWAHGHVETLSGRGVMEDPDGAAADLCGECLEQLEDWFCAVRAERAAQ